jgi:general stress protein YciG
VGERRNEGKKVDRGIGRKGGKKVEGYEQKRDRDKGEMIR